MNNKIEILNNELVDSVNLILEDYKNLIVNYEDSRHLYEDIINKYETDSSDAFEIKCSRLICYNLSPYTVTWKIVLLNDKLIYQSKPHLKDETLTLDLNTILVPNTQFKIQASCSTLDYSAIYVPDSNATAYFNASTSLQYLAIVPIHYIPNSQPTLKCSSVSIYNYSDTSSKVVLYTVDGVQLYESITLAKEETITINLIDINILAYTLFKVKAVIVDSGETVADITLEYVVDDIYQSDFILSGTTKKNELMYVGISPYDPNSNKIKCSNLVAYNLIATVTTWKIVLLDGTVVYNSNNYLQYETFTLDLTTLDISPGTQFKLIAVNDLKPDTLSGLNFEYKLNSSTVYFELNTFKSDPHLYYNGLSPTDTTPPYIKVSEIIAKHTEYPVIMRWQLIDEKGKVIYESGRCSNGSSAVINLSSLNIGTGVRLKLKASVTAGADSSAYILLEHDPASNIVAKFGFYGNAFKTIVPFKGTE